MSSSTRYTILTETHDNGGNLYAVYTNSATCEAWIVKLSCISDARMEDSWLDDADDWKDECDEKEDVYSYKEHEGDCIEDADGIEDAGDHKERDDDHTEDAPKVKGRTYTTAQIRAKGGCRMFIQYERIIFGKSKIHPNNSLLLLLSSAELRYMFVGRVIHIFSLTRPIVKLYTPLGNSSAQYPFAVDKDGSVIILDGNDGVFKLSGEDLADDLPSESDEEDATSGDDETERREIAFDYDDTVYGIHFDKVAHLDNHPEIEMTKIPHISKLGDDA